MPKSFEGPGPKAEGNEFEGEMTLQDLRTLLAYSFRYSQGNNVLQKQLFKYIHCANPNWKPSRESLQNIKKEIADPKGEAHEMLKKSFGSIPKHPTIGPSEISDTGQNMFERLESALSEPLGSDRQTAESAKDAVIKDVILGMVTQDWSYVVLEKRREDSYLFEMLNGAYVHPFFKRMVEDMRTYIADGKLDPHRELYSGQKTMTPQEIREDDESLHKILPLIREYQSHKKKVPEEIIALLRE